MFFLESIFLTKQAWTNQLSPQPLKRINTKKGPHRARGSQIQSSFSHNHGSVEKWLHLTINYWRYTHFLLPWLWENMVITTTALPLETESLGAPSQELARVEPVLGPKKRESWWSQLGWKLAVQKPKTLVVFNARYVFFCRKFVKKLLYHPGN